MKLRIKFSKEGIMKYIGHLDMMRYFQKAFRRSGIDIAYSQGFSPHQLISFAAPLGVGLTSRGEYMDIMANSSFDSQTMVDLLNKEMVEGVKILSCRRIDDETKNSNAMAILAAADYEIEFSDPRDFDEAVKSAFTAFMDQEHIQVTKKTKKSQREVDIRPLIYGYEVHDHKVFLRLAAGSLDNLKPEFVMETFMQTLGKTFEGIRVQICRLEMYAKDPDKGLVALENLGYDMD